MESLKEILPKLKQQMPYKWRVQSYSKFKPQASCVAYIDSRDVQDVLDANCLWSDRYYEENGMLFCEITIYADGREYKRSDTGSESNVDKQKGHSSDAFKRAAVKFGIGRFLYSLPLHKVSASEKKTNNNYPFVVDDRGQRVYDLTTYINNISTTNKPTINKPTPIDFDRLKQRLEACADVEQLKSVYKSFTDIEQKALSAVTTDMKVKLTPKQVA